MADCEGDPVDLGGYCLPDPALTEAAMRPSPTFNDILGSCTAGAST